MKKNKFLSILLIFLTSSVLYSYKFEIINEISFDNFFQYYENWPDDKGYSGPGIRWLINYNGDFFGRNEANNKGFLIRNNSIEKINDDMSYYEKSMEDICVINTTKNRKIFLNKIDYNNPDYIIPDPDINSMNELYARRLWYTENYIFAQTGKYDLICWELLSNGEVKYHDYYETQDMLIDGLQEKLGIETDEFGDYYFGEFSMYKNDYPNVRNIWKENTFLTPGYENYKNTIQWSYILGTTKNGLSLSWGVKPRDNINFMFNPDYPMILFIAVLDPWKNEVNVIELEPGTWNPPRDKERGLIASMSQCIDSDGNIYFTDCDKAKGCYQIKKLSNDWLKQYDFYNRPIARMTKNHIPLYEKPSEDSDNDGYNFDHEYLWLLGKKANWLHVRKVDGREGWVPLDVVKLNDGVNLEELENAYKNAN